MVSSLTDLKQDLKQAKLVLSSVQTQVVVLQEENKRLRDILNRSIRVRAQYHEDGWIGVLENPPVGQPNACLILDEGVVSKVATKVATLVATLETTPQGEYCGI